MIFSRLLKGMLLLTVGTSPQLVSAGAPPLERLSTWGGRVDRVSVDGNLAYVPAGQRVLVLDVTNPASPVEIADVNLASAIMDMERQDDLLFLTTGWDNCPKGQMVGSFVIVDVSTPSDPYVLSTNTWGACDARSRSVAVAVIDDIAYVGQNVLEIWDVSDPAEPVFVRYLWDWTPEELVVVEDQVRLRSLLIVMDRDRVDILDIADRTDPVQLGWFEPPTDWAEDMAVAGDILYIAGGDAGLLAIDFSDPESPVQIAQVPGLGTATAVAVGGTVAYLGIGDNDQARTPGAFITVHVSDPANPQVLKRVDLHGSVTRITVAGTIAYVGDQGEGLRVFDVFDPQNPVQIGRYYSPGRLAGMDKEGDVLYIADRYHALTAVDVSDPHRPVPLGDYETGRWSYRVRVRDGLAYLAAGHSGFEIIDVSDPSDLKPLGGYPTGNYTNCVDVAGDIAVVGREYNRFDVITVLDVSNAQNPQLLSSVTLTWDLLYDIVIQGTYAYVARTPGYVIVDISDPENAFAAFYHTGISPKGTDIEIQGDLLYGTEPWGYTNEGLHIIGNTDPLAPRNIGYFPVQACHGVAVLRNLAYMATQPLGLVVADVSDPTNPVEVGRSDLGDRAELVLVVGPYAYMTNLHGGLDIYRIAEYGDYDGDRDIDRADFAMLQRCLTGPDSGPLAGGCHQGDFDTDDDIDLDDYTAFITAYTGPS